MVGNVGIPLEHAITPRSFFYPLLCFVFELSVNGEIDEIPSVTRRESAHLAPATLRSLGDLFTHGVVGRCYNGRSTFGTAYVFN